MIIVIITMITFNWIKIIVVTKLYEYYTYLCVNILSNYFYNIIETNTNEELKMINN